MANITIPNTFVTGTSILASEMNANFNAITAQVNGNLDSTNLANSAVTENKIANLAVSEGKLAASAVTTAKIANSAVTNAKMAANSVDSTQLVADSVTAAKVADDAILTANILDDAVTPSKTSFWTGDLLDTGDIHLAKILGSSGTLIGGGAFTFVKNSPGNYAVTHNWSASVVGEYLVFATIDGGGGDLIVTVNQLADRFDVDVEDPSGTRTDADVSLLVVRRYV